MFRRVATTCCLAMLMASPARAQTASALDRLDPAPAGDTFVSVPSPEVLGDMRAAAAATLVYTDSPLVLASRSDEDRIIRELVSHQLTFHGGLSLELAHRVKLDLALPMVIDQSGEAADFAAFRAPAPPSSAAGDLRLGSRVELIRQAGHWPAAALALNLWLPTGNPDAYTGAGALRVAPSLVVGADHGILAWSTHAAARLQPETDEGTLLGSEVLFGAAVGPRLGPVRIAVEVFGTALLDRDVPGATLSSTSLNGLLTAAWVDGPVQGRIGAGPGLSRGVGTPDWRVLGTLAYAPFAPSHEDRLAAERRDRDAAPDTPPPSDEPSRDAVFLEDEGAAPVAPPPDRDGDGIADGRDACPEAAGPASPDPAQHGCPRDSDGDGILDAQDACPKEAGPANEDPDKNGCPTAVRVVGDQIVILQRVEFATGKAIIVEASTEVLRQVAAVMAEHPEIARVGVDGHTDSVGREASNISLSQRRALAVVDWLVAQGVDARRLEARGFGPRQPIADNDSDAGRQKNRRVEFNILHRTKEGEAGWIDGELP